MNSESIQNGNIGKMNMFPTLTSGQGNGLCIPDLARPHYLGSFVCNILGDRASLYLKGQELTAEIYSAKRGITQLNGSQIKGGRDGDMPIDELIQLVQTVAAPFLFVSYQSDTLRIFARDFQEIQKNQFLKPRITFPSKYFTCIRRKKTLNKLQSLLQEKQIVTLLNDPSVPLKRIGKTEIATQYFEEYQQDYAHAFWIQAFDPWYFKQDIEKMAETRQIPTEKIQKWLSDNTSYLIVFDGIEDHETIKSYLPSSPKGHIIITSRVPFSTNDSLKVSLFTPEEGVAFLSTNAKGSQEDAQRVAQSLGYVPSSLYRAVEILEAENLALSDYEIHCQALLEKHAQQVRDKSNLPPRNRDFVGREPGLVALEESFSKNKPVVLAANAGLGGIGKTQIAIQYAYRTCPNYTLIWWINCGNMQLSYDDLAKRLGVQLEEEEKKQENALIKKVNFYLERKPGWLLIFDNAADEKSLEGLLPQSGGHVLITSRNPTWDKTQTEVFGIEVFKREESIDLILKVTGRYDQDKEAGELAEELKDLPLGIAQAAAYIRETKISIQEYIEDFKKVHKALWRREEATNNYEFTVNVTWNISMEKIQEIEQQNAITLQPIALPLMQICSFFAPSDIPREALLLDWLKTEYEASQRSTDACIEDLNQTLKLLEQFSMIYVSEVSISVHALVQVVVRDQLSAEKQQEMYEQAFEVMVQAIGEFREQDVATWSQPKLCIPHGIALFEREESMKAVGLPIQYQLVTVMGRIYVILGDFRQALKLCQNCVIIAEKWIKACPDLKESHGAAAKSYSSIAVVCGHLGITDEALELHRKAINIRLEVFGENHPDVATSYNNIGNVYDTLEDYDKALEHYQKALKLWLQMFGENHLDVAASYNNFGNIYGHIGDYNKSLEFYQKALKVFLQVVDENHPDVATNYHNIGSVYTNFGDHNKALEFHQKALKIWLQVFGENHPDVAKSYHSIGGVHHIFGDYGKALEFYQKVLRIWLQVFGENHPDVARNYNNIGLTYRNLGEYDKALEFHQKALKIWLQMFDENHLGVAKSYSNIGLVYGQTRDYSKALEFCQKALKINLQVLSENHPDVAGIYHNMGLIYCQAREYNKALEFCQKAFVIFCNAYRRPHPDIINVLESLFVIAGKLQSSQVNALGTIYPLCVQTLGIEHKMTQKLRQFISAKNPSLLLEFVSRMNKENARETNAALFPCLQNDESSLIYDLHVEKELFEEKSEESAESGSFIRAIRCLSRTQSKIIFNKICDFKDSTWNPDQNINDLLQVLRKYGLIIIGGEFGKHCYEELPVKVDKNQLAKSIREWPRNAKRLQDLQLHFVIVVGVVKIESSTNAGGYIYFIDPSDPSDRDNPENDVLYKISYQSLKAHTKKSRLMNGYAVYDSAGK